MGCRILFLMSWHTWSSKFSMHSSHVEVYRNARHLWVPYLSYLAQRCKFSCGKKLRLDLHSIHISSLLQSISFLFWGYQQHSACIRSDTWYWWKLPYLNMRADSVYTDKMTGNENKCKVVKCRIIINCHRMSNRYKIPVLR